MEGLEARSWRSVARKDSMDTFADKWPLAAQRPIEIASVQLASKTGLFQRLFQWVSGAKAIESSRLMERAMGIEPTSEAWEASILPLYDARSRSK